MLPVRAFDPAISKALNRSKARAYAAQALAKYLKTGSLTIRGLEILESGITGGSFRFVAVVPRDGVSAGAASPDAGMRRKPANNASRPPTEPKRWCRLRRDPTGTRSV